MTQNKLDIVVLAAGKSARFGGIKQLAKVHNEYMLQSVLKVCLAQENYSVNVVLGANKEALLQEIDFENAVPIDNPKWQRGMSSSIVSAVEHLQHNCDAMLFIAADQIAISAGDLSNLISAWRLQPDKIVSAKFDNTISLPIIFPASFFSQLLQLTGDKGGKHLVQANPTHHLSVEMPNAAIDIDTRDDAARFAKECAN